MRSLVKFFFVLFFVTLAFYSKAQYAIAGVPGSLYKDINPDTLLNSVYNSWAAETYSIDINQDGTPDVAISSYAGVSPGGSVQSCEVKSLDTSRVSLFFLREDSTHVQAGCGGVWVHMGAILKPFVNGDTIKNGVYVRDGYLAEGQGTLNCFNFWDGAWVSNNDQYVGVKYRNGINITYGWIRVLVSNLSTVLVKDYSLGAPVNSVSMYTASAAILFFPNPASDKIFVDCADAEEIQLMSCQGELLAKGKREIDVREINNGVYIIKVRTRAGYFAQKIIVRH